MPFAALERSNLMAAQKKQDVVVDEGAVYINRAGTPIYIKTADVCAMTGKSNQWIGQLTSQGTLNKQSTPHGAMYELTSTMHAYCTMLDNRAREAFISTDKERAAAEVSLKKAKATKAVLETKELLGQMHRAEDVALMTEDWFFAIRGMMLALPGRLAIDVANISDPAEASARIRDEVYLIMQEMSNYQYDPKKYEELVRERLSWDKIDTEEGADDDG